MPWTLKSTIPTPDQGLHYTWDNLRIYARCLSGVVAWHRATGEIAWKLDFQDLGQSSDIFRVDDIIIASSRGRGNGETGLVGLRASDGAVRWRVPTHKVSEGYGVVRRGHYLSRRGSPGPFFSLDPAKGTSTETGASPLTFSLSVVDDRLVVGCLDGVYLSGPDDLTLHRVVSCQRASGLASDATGLYFQCLTDDGIAVAWSDLAGRFECFVLGPAAKIDCLPTGRAGRVWIRHSEGAWLACVDVLEQRIVWRVDLRVAGAVVTPHGLVAVVGVVDTFHTHVYAVDDDGALTPAIAATAIVKSVGYVDGSLLVSRAKNLDHFIEVYEWTDGPAVVHEVPLPKPSPMKHLLASVVSNGGGSNAPVVEFATLMGAAPADQVALIRAFNANFDAWLAANPTESVGTFAVRVAAAGGDPASQARVLQDLIRIRQG